MIPRRSFLNKTFAAMAAFSFFPASGLMAKRPGKEQFKHIVFFWLKNPSDTTARKKFEQELRNLTENVDVIVSSHIGIPASTNRDVIDSSYSYNLLLTFKNQEDQEKYQKHPMHLKFIENAAHLWQKVVVYDSVIF